MKHGMFQRSVSLLLALVMILGNVPMNALAAEGEETTAPACEHSYDAVTTDATCSQDGSVVYTCACGDTYTETIPATGEHAWGDWTVTAEATYEAAGLETRACGCGATEEREIPQLVAAHEHAWGDWTVAAEATYEAAGLETRTCECGETENREIPQLVKVKAELSGNTRKLYFLNTEAWEEVHVFWSFEEEDFEDVAFPGVKMEADEDLENVFVVELPVEADAVTFNDGVEVTEELKTYERENGIEAIHFFEAELNEDEELSVFSADAQVEQEKEEDEVTEWATYKELLKAWEEAEAALAAEAIAAVQALIDDLPTEFASQDEVDEFWLYLEVLDAVIASLPDELQVQLKTANYDAAIDAAAAFFNPEQSSTWELSDEPSEEDTEVIADSYEVGDEAAVKGNQTNTPTGDIPEGSEWKFVGRTTNTTCGKEEHSHTDECYNIPNALACPHFLESTLLGHPDTCTVANLSDPCSKWYCLSSHKTVNGTRYHVKFECQHNHTVACYTTACNKEHAHIEPDCYSYTWKLVWKQYTITWKWQTAEGEQSKTSVLAHNSAPVAPLTPPNYQKDGVTYTFTGWDLPAKVTGEATYSAKYTAKTVYAVTFDSKGGSEVAPETFEVVNGTVEGTVAKPDDPTKPGFDFKGWYVDEACTTEYTFGNKPTGSITLYAKWMPDANDNDVDDTQETVNIAVSVTGSGTAALNNGGNAKIIINGTKVIYDSATEGGNVIHVTATPSGKSAPNKGYYLKSLTFNDAAVNDGKINAVNGTVAVVFAEEEFTLTAGDRKILVNGFDNDTKVNSNLKKQVLDDVLPAGYEIDDYEVRLLTTYELGEIKLGTRYYNVEGETGKFLYWDYEIPASWFVTQLTVDGETPNKFEVVKLASATTCGEDLIVSDVEFAADEERDPAKIRLTQNAFTVNSYDEVAALVKGAVQVEKDGTWTTINAEHLTISGMQNVESTQQITITVTGESADYETNTTGISATITITLNDYTVTWNPNGGNWNGVTTNDVDTYHKGDAIVPAAAPTLVGHTFKGWGAEVAATMGTTSLVYTAQWEINSYKYVVNTYEMGLDGKYPETPKATDTFSGNYNTTANAETKTVAGFTVDTVKSTLSGTIPAENNALVLNVYYSRNNYDVIWKWQNAEGEQTTTVTLPYGTAIQVPAEIPTQYKVGNVTYTRTGWTGLVDGATVPVDGITYTATYTTATAWIVDFNSDGGSEVVDVTVIVPEGETAVVAKPADPTREGYRFDGWFLGDEAYDFATPVTKHITLTAKWVKQVTVSFDVEGEGYKDQTFDINGVATEPTAPTKDQAIFGGWLLNGEKYDFTAPVTADITLTAKWIADINRNGVADEDETIAINIEGNGSVTIKGVYLVEEETVEEPAADAAVEPIAEAGDTVVDAKSGNYIFNSKTSEIIITATPVVEGGFSKSYVKQIGAKGTAALTFAEDGTFAAAETIEVKDADELKVVFETVPVLKATPDVVKYNFYTKDIPYEDIFKSVVAAPDMVGAKVEYEYLARDAYTATVTLEKLGLTGSVKTILNTIGIDDFEFEMDQLWLPLNATVEPVVSLETMIKSYLSDDVVGNLTAKYQQVRDDYINENGGGILNEVIANGLAIAAVVDDVNTIRNNINNSAVYYNAHSFGYNATGELTKEEQIKIKYSDPSMKWETDATVVLEDSRKPSFITGSDLTVTYRDYLDADLLANFGLVNADGEVIDGAIHSVELEDGHTFENQPVSVEAYPLEILFDGDATYRPAEKTFNITVVKAGLSIDLPNLNITHGDTYDPYANVNLANAYGDKQEVIDSLVQIFIGLDVAGLKLTEENKIDGLATHVQITLPRDEMLAKIFTMIPALKDVYTDKGVTLNLAELQSYLDQIDDALTQFDPDNETVSGITNILSSVTGLVDLSALEITIGGSYPTDTGIYLYGAVSTSSNYETAFDVAYMVIAPETAKYTLKWNAEMPSVVTLPVFQQMDIGAKAIEDENFKAGYLILGINDETGDIYTTDIYGNIKLNVWADPAKINDNGAYVQMAYGLNYGDNKLAYAIPIVRSFAIVPGITEMEIVVDNQATADLYKTVFDNAPVDVTVRGVIPEGGQVKFHYYGIEANTKTYDSDIAPTHTGAYAITATLVTRDANGEMTSVGLDVATVVIQPTESAVTMKELETVTYDGQGHKVSEVMEIVASSTVENLKPDTTVITASIATDGSFSENGWAAAQGTVNVDFPRWMDELIAKYAPSVKDGITLSELEAKLLNKLPTITDKLEELGATNEMVNSTKNLLTNVSSLLEEMPADAVLSFKDDYEVLAVGTYAVAAVVTDSDHIPSVDAGLLVIVPDADQVFLDWDYHDENNIWSRELLQNVSINATAFNDKAFTKPNAQATAKITYQFIGLDQDAGLKIYTDPAQLPNGVYTQIAYIELEVDSQIILSDIIARTIMIVPNMPELQIVDVNGAAQNKFEFTFDNEPVELYVNQNGTRIENEIRYIGLQTNGVEYDRTVAPVHAGVYTAITVVKTQENVGMDVALVTIAPAKSTISVTGGTVPYNGKEQTATVKAESPNSTVTSPDYILISGTVDISAGVQNIGLESLHGDVNIDLPKWLDDVLAKTDFNRVDADVASLANAISAYRDDLMNLIPEQVLEQIAMSNETLADIIKKVNSGIDELLKILEKLPDDVHLTFENNKGYSELGSYFYYGIVADSDHIPAADTGLLVIEPAEITSVEVTSLHTYNGQAQTATVVVKAGDVELTEDCYTISGNVAIDADNYTVTVVGMGNYTGTRDASWSIAPKLIKSEDVTLDGYATYNGTAFVQNVIVKDGEKTLEANKDYTVEGNTATQVAKNTLTVKGTGNYTGEVTVAWSSGYPIHFQSGDANGMIEPGATVFVDDAAYVLDKNCVAWTADKDRELAIGYVYEISKNHTTDHAYSDTTKNMYIWDLQWNEETGSYNARRVEALDNLLSFAGGSIWLGSNGVNGIRTYYSTTADTEAVKGAFRNLGYEVVTHGVVVGWADKLNGSEPVPNGNNSAAGHSAGNGTFYDEIYPAADKYITPDLRARFYVELKNIETSESKIIYSGSVERSIGYIAYQNIGRVDAQYQPYVKAILDKAAAAGFTYGG